MTEEQLDVALSKVCMSFDVVLYQKLQDAYSLLGKTQVNLYYKWFIIINNNLS